MTTGTRHIDAGRASALLLHLLARAIPMLTRNELASLTERLIDGDPDSEETTRIKSRTGENPRGACEP